MITPEPITIDGKPGVVVYINAKLRAVTKDKATAARVIFDDGTAAFFLVNAEPSSKSV